MMTPLEPPRVRELAGRLQSTDSAFSTTARHEFAQRQVKERSGARTKMSIGGWTCIAIFIGLVLGLVVAYKTGNESTGFLFGMALMVFLPFAFLYAIVEAIASSLRKSD